jgi:formylglycine-generating enzyme required for sulfatase activity
MTFIKIPNKSYEMADSPVTQKEWVELMDSNPSHFAGEDNNPVESVSWNMCQEFIKKLNDKKDGYIYALPTEAQWEFCAKSCADQPIMDIAWCWENSEKTTHRVKEKLPNALGLYDMLGNVWEWCDDLVDGSDRGVRGGGWGNGAQNLRPAGRSFYSPGYRGFAFGFRLIREDIKLSPLTILPWANGKIALAVAKAQSALDELKEILK